MSYLSKIGGSNALKSNPTNPRPIAQYCKNKISIIISTIKKIKIQMRNQNDASQSNINNKNLLLKFELKRAIDSENILTMH
jgi:hypothetical protein